MSTKTLDADIAEVSEEIKNEENKIILTCLNGTGFIFNAEDYMQVREKHRIIGSLVGASSRHGCSGNESALPAQLTIYETRLLIDEGIALLVSKRDSLLREPTEAELAEIKLEQDAMFVSQEAEQRAEKLRETEANMDRILSGKRKKLEREGRLDEAKALSAEVILDETAKAFKLTPEDVLVETPLEYPKEHCATILRLPEIAKNSFEYLKYRVFRDIWLHGKNYFITPGESFGGDFLVYPGDPMLYHAKYIVIVLQEDCDFEKVHLRPMNLVIKARLAINVNKTCVFAYLDADSNEVRYQIVEWEGDPEKQLQKSES